MGYMVLSVAERRVYDYLLTRGLTVGLFTKSEKRETRTPDFRVCKGNELAFYCEVKNAQEDRWLRRSSGVTQ